MASQLSPTTIQAAQQRRWWPHPCPVCGDLIDRDGRFGHHPETYERCHLECLSGLDEATLTDMQQEGHL